jgi:hypothetical protein
VVGTPAVLTGVAVVTAAQFAFTYLPPLQAVFGTRPVSVPDGIVIVMVGVVMLLAVETEKRLRSAIMRPSEGLRAVT